MKPIRVLFLVHEGSGVMRVRAESFLRRLRPPLDARLLVKDACPGGKFARVLALMRGVLGRAGWRCDVLYILDVGVASLAAAAAARVLGRMRVVVDTGDLYGELQRESGRFGPVGAALRETVERLLLGLADLVVVRGRFHREYLKRRGFTAVAWIPDGVESPGSRPDSSPDAKRKLGVDGFFTVGVMGSAVWSPKHRYTYGWELVEVVALLRDLPVRGIFIGDGDGIEHVKARAAELGVSDRIVFTGRVEYDELATYLPAIDVCISTQSMDWVGRARTTGKLPEYLSCGRYILATCVGEAASILPEEMLVPYRGKKDEAYPARLAQRIRALVAEPRRLALGRELKPLALRFDYDRLAADLQDLLIRTV